MPFGDKEKSVTFERELDTFIDKEKNMEALTMRDLRDIHVREQERWAVEKEFKEERKLAQKMERLLQKTERLRQEEVQQRQEEARLRQEEAQRREEAEKKLVDMMFELHKQGFSLEKIASMMGQSLDSIQGIMDKKP